MAGRHWLNSGMLDYVWQDLPGIGATPQIAVVRRTVTRPSEANPTAPYSISDEELVTRKVGLLEIRWWLEQDGRLPDLSQAVLAQTEPATPQAMDQFALRAP